MKEGAALAAAGQAKSTGRLGVCARARRVPAAHTSSPAFMKHPDLSDAAKRDAVFIVDTGLNTL
jgi:hypothetical protein